MTLGIGRKDKASDMHLVKMELSAGAGGVRELARRRRGHVTDFQMGT